MKNNSLFSAFLALVLFMGCKSDDAFDGPSLNDLYGQFSIVEPLTTSNDDVDFSSGQTTFFRATFSKNIAWTLHITGLSSGAMKEITGFSNILDATNSTWNGTTTRLPLFRIEDCAVELTFENEADTLRDTLHIAGTRINEGFLLSDFENGVNSGWSSFAQTGANMSFGVLSSDSAAQGNNFFDMAGVVDWDWLLGYLYLPATAYGSATFPLSSNPDEVFFNTLIYKPENLNNGLLLFQFTEDDNLDGVFTSASEDMYSIQVSPTEAGWSQLSVNYSDLVTLINGSPAAPAGNGIHEPHKLTQVNILFLKNPTSGFAHARLDYMIFTQGAPLIP
jgi:hypothetical protein